MINIDVKKEKLIKWLFLFSLIGFIVLILGAVIFLCVKKFILNSAFDLFSIGIADLFSDFSQVIKFALSPNPYQPSVGTSYLPLAILVIYPFALICKNVAHLSYYDLLFTSQFWLSYLLFLCISFVCIVLLLKKLVNVRGKFFVFFCLTWFFSGMAWYMIARGNNILLVLVFVLFFLVFYKSGNKALRELALISLAIAGVIKIYPLFFGIVLLMDKKIFRAARVGIYTVALIFLPFLFFDGGFSNIKLFLVNLLDFSYGGGRLLLLRNMSATGLIYKFFDVIAPQSADMATVSKVFSIIAIVIVAAFALVGSFLSKDKLSLYMICVAVMVLIPSVSYYYVIMFLIIPLIEFVNDYENLPKARKWFYLVFFITVPCVIFCPFRNFLYQALSLVAVLFYEAINNLHVYKKERKKEKICQGA